MDIEDFYGIAIVICVVAIGFIACLFPVYIADRWDCSSYQDATGRSTKYKGLQCYVIDDNGKWRSMDEMKIRNATKGE